MSRISVIGAGPMGRLHARAIARRASQYGDCELGFVVDRHAALRESVAGEFGGTAESELSAVLSDADARGEVARSAAIVAVPTAAHAEIAEALLGGGVDILLEKPMTGDLALASRLVERAEALGRVLAVGHVEWFNSTRKRAWEHVSDPREILIERMNPESERGLDIDVVQDFMLHDLDWLRRSVVGEIDSIEASGRDGRGQGLDQAEAILRFTSGLRARVLASRVHEGRRRRIQIEGHRDGERVRVDADLLSGVIDVRKADDMKRIESAPLTAMEGDQEEPLDSQFADFLNAVETRSQPANHGRVGLETLALVERVREAIAHSAGATGSHD